MSKKNAIINVLLLILLSVSTVGCNSQKGENKKMSNENIPQKDDEKMSSKPNLLFVMADQWRRHALGCMGQDPVITPNMDKFAGKSLLFTNALSVAPLCVPARASILTGRYPITTTVVDTSCKLPDNEVSIAHILNDAGYHTGYIGKWHLDGGGPRSYVAPERRAGFQFWYANNLNHNHYLIDSYTGTDTHIYKEGWQVDDEADAAINYIKEHKNQPFALFVSWAPPHPGQGREGQIQGSTIYTAPEKYEAMYRDVRTTGRLNFTSCESQTGPRAPKQENGLPGYFGAITNIDDNFGRIMETLEQQGIADNTIVVLTSDHGDMLGSQESWGKKIWYEESIGVPFIIGWPSTIKPGRTDALFNQIDILPSLLGLVGIDIPQNVEGTNFASLMQEREMEQPDYAYIFYGNNKENRVWRCVRTKKYSYVICYYKNKKTAESMLYDLEKDPYQMDVIKLGQGYDEVIKELDGKLRDWLNDTKDPFLQLLN